MAPVAAASPVAAWLALKAQVVQGKDVRSAEPRMMTSGRQHEQEAPTGTPPRTFLERKLRAVANGEQSIRKRLTAVTAENSCANRLARLPIVAVADLDAAASIGGVFTREERRHYAQRLAILQRAQRLRKSLRELQRRQIESPEHTAAVVFANLLREVDHHHHWRRLADLASSRRATALAEGAAQVLTELDSAARDRESGSAVSEVHALLEASRAARASMDDAIGPLSPSERAAPGPANGTSGTSAADVLESALQSTRDALKGAQEAGFM